MDWYDICKNFDSIQSRFSGSVSKEIIHLYKLLIDFGKIH